MLKITQSTVTVPAPLTNHNTRGEGVLPIMAYNRELKQIATAGATTASVTEKVWGEYVAAVCQILAK